MGPTDYLHTTRKGRPYFRAITAIRKSYVVGLLRFSVVILSDNSLHPGSFFEALPSVQFK